MLSAQKWPKSSYKNKLQIKLKKVLYFIKKKKLQKEIYTPQKIV